jgi:predicted NUDIX family phosphoesterase
MTAALAYNHTTGEYNVSEQVLVFPAQLIDGFQKDAPGGILTDPLKVWSYLRRTVYAGKAFYMDRAAAEVDPNFKQIIPYVVFIRPGEVFAYQRTPKSGEGRLHGKWSIGIGGHINPVDGEPFDDNSRRVYWKAFERELFEEVSFVCQGSKKTHAPVSALIYLDHGVHAVHFGVVHLFSVPAGTQLASRDPAITAGGWLDVEDLHARQLEEWSRLTLEHVLLDQAN